MILVILAAGPLPFFLRPAIATGNAVQVGSTSPDFGLGASPGSLVITRGSSGTSFVSVTSVNNFTGVVSLIATVTPSGLTLSLNASSVPVPPMGLGTSSLTVSTTTTTAAGSYTVSVTGTNGNITQSTTIEVTVVSPIVSSLAIDGAANNFCSHFTNSCSTMLTTEHQNDIIIVYTAEGLDLVKPCTFNVSDTAGLSWSARSAIIFDLTGRAQLQEFWARSSTPLTADFVTESILGCQSPEFGGEYNGLIVFGITGANVNNPFDSNISLPSSGNGYGTNTVISVSTNNPEDMIIGVAMHGNVCCALTAGPGFSQITTNQAGVMTAEYENTAENVTNFSVTFSDAATHYWTSIGDAVQAFSTAPDFSVSASPGTLMMKPGSDANATITVSSFNNFSGSITLASTVSPSTFSGPTATLGQVAVMLMPNQTATSLLAVNTVAATPPGTYTVTVKGSNGTLTRSASISVVVPSPDFVISVSNSSLTLPAGQSVNETLQLASTNGFNGTVTLNTSVFGFEGLSAAINPSIVNLSPNENTTSTLTVNAGFPPFVPTSFTVTVTGSSGAILHSVSVEVTVLSPPPDFHLSVAQSFTIFAGQNETIGIVLYPTGGFSGTVTLTASVSPMRLDGPQVSVNPAAVQLSQNSTIIFGLGPVLEVSTTSITPPGDYTITITGTSGSLTHTATVVVEILPPPTITLSPSSGVDGTQVTVTGHGFPTSQQSFPVQFPVTIDFSFDNQFIGFISTDNGAFTFTFNVPLSQPGAHTVRAITGFPILTATALFTVAANPSPISVAVNTGTIYFPGDTAVIYIMTTSTGTSIGPANLQVQVTLVSPNGTRILLTVISVGPGLYKSTYAIPSSGAILGTYAVIATAHEAGFQDGSSLTSFEIKLSWLASNTKNIATAAALVGSVGTAVVGVVAWQKGYFRRKNEDPANIPF